MQTELRHPRRMYAKREQPPCVDHERLPPIIRGLACAALLCGHTMKTLSETQALEKLHQRKTEFAASIRTRYEHRAKECSTCGTPGACCLDAHFVNVHITRLEATAIRRTLETLPEEKRAQVRDRIASAITTYGLSDGSDTFSQTYACPLFEKGTGCLVHRQGKPLPCIAHACYENKEDLPPDTLLAEQEGLVEKLNELTYLKRATWLPLPIALREERQP